MTLFGIVILFMWLPVCVALIAILPPVQAVAYGYLGAMMFLPTGTMPLSGLPDIDKWQMAGLGLTAGMLLFRGSSLSNLRLALPDWLLIGFMVCTAITSLANDLGMYDAISSVLRNYLLFGCPYFLVRIFCRRDRDVLVLIGTVILAAALYAIPALWEFRLSPQMHRTLYGYSFQGWREHYRFGFYRPLLFFEHAIPLAFFFASASIMSIYMWFRGIHYGSGRLSARVLVGLTTLGTVISMTYGAYFAWAVSLTTLLLARKGRWQYCALLPMGLAIGWSAARYLDVVETAPLIDMAYRQFSETAAQSFEYRLIADSSLLNRARQARWFGWGGWGRNRIDAADKWGQPVAIDSLWVNMVGKYGLIGLVLFYAWFAVATVKGLRCIERIHSPSIQAVAYALVVMAGLELINWQLNGFVNPTVLFGVAVLTSLSQMVARPVVQQNVPPVTLLEPA